MSPILSLGFSYFQLRKNPGEDKPHPDLFYYNFNTIKKNKLVNNAITLWSLPLSKSFFAILSAQIKQERCEVGPFLSFSFLYFQHWKSKSVVNSIFIILSAQTKTFCQEWASDETIRHMIKTASQQSSPCPCYKQQAELEHSYEQMENCFTEYFFTNGVKQKCCYK